MPIPPPRNPTAIRQLIVDRIPGRGTAINPPNRFERLHLEADPDADPGPEFTEQIRELFKVTARRAGLNQERSHLSTAHFRRPGGVQMSLFPG